MEKEKERGDPAFQPTASVKGLRFGGQLMIKNFKVRRAAPLEFSRLLSTAAESHPFPTTAAFIPTNFSILAQHAWRTLTLGLGTKKSKVVVFVFESEQLKSMVERVWPLEISLGEVNKKLIRALPGCEMARFKFRKGCITFYVYAVRRQGSIGFARSEDLKHILQSIVALNDFLDHTAMLATPHQRSISYSMPMAVAH
ncbi:hypothetical protein SUGI_0135120 [Cryptomeria japonica]|uniref:uncharacterized protein LOC131035021 n=1 Tax=Cryptomeria japonica TaxID=3369 RepID=UPI002408DD03|nr:uncharacterized protein LOC131035021 [Cryptomeria japonica]GLJ10787.1 hypothetical protein SUGI_0135120 [Cryptomeria japonica]